jgi:hypothetical protein
MKGTDKFKEIIKNYLDEYAEKDQLFKNKYLNLNKSIDECVNYIITQVKNSGINGFADEEIFSMAIHYYDEENIEVNNINCNVIVNHHIELSSEEIEDTKKKAREKLYFEEQQRLKTSKNKPKEKQEQVIQQSLF